LCYNWCYNISYIKYMEDVAMQTHCLGCWNQLYAPAIYQWSHWGLICSCWYVSIKMSNKDYRKLIKKGRI